jgi:hypothetical protein
LAGIFQKEKNDGSFFCGNSGRVRRTYLLVMTPIFKGQPELMAAIPHLNDLTAQLTLVLTQPFSIFPRSRELISHSNIQAFLLPSPSLFLLLLFLFFFSSLFTINGFFFEENEEGKW